MKVFFKLLGWVFLGIFIQFKFNALYGIVFLENLNFHERTYIVQVQMTQTEESLRVLRIQTTVHHSLGPDYFAHVYLPETYRVLNKKPYPAAEAISGYVAYKMNMKRRYRDVLSAEDFIIQPVDLKNDIPDKPIIVHFENMKQRLHSDQTYLLSTTASKTQLQGPELVEVKYPQKLGM